MELGAAEFQTVQRIYRGWELFGVVVLSALASTLALKIGLRRHPTAFTPALVAVLCIVAGRFLDLHIPVNRMTINWTMLPHNWAELRASWEYSHVASASLNAAAVIALTVSLREHHDGDRVARGGLRRTQRGWCFSNKRSPVLPPPTRCGNWLANQESVRCSTACACRTRCEPIHGHKERYDDVVR